MVQRGAELDPAIADGCATIGITAGASAPDVLVEEVLDRLRERFAVTTEEVVVAVEDVIFRLPPHAQQRLMAVYTEVTDEALRAFLADYDARRAGRLPRHRRRGGELQLRAEDRGRRFHPHACTRSASIRRNCLISSA